MNDKERGIVEIAILIAAAVVIATLIAVILIAAAAVIATLIARVV